MSTAFSKTNTQIINFDYKITKISLTVQFNYFFRQASKCTFILTAKKQQYYRPGLL